MRVTVTRGAVALALVAVAAVHAAAGPAAAQSLSPMRGEVSSFADTFAVRVAPGNPYQHRIRIEVKVYDEAFAPVAAQVMPPEMMVGAQDRRNVTVLVPFDGRNERKVRICAESVPFENEPTRLRTQVCGKFLAHRVH